MMDVYYNIYYIVTYITNKYCIYLQLNDMLIQLKFCVTIFMLILVRIVELFNIFYEKGKETVIHLYIKNKHTLKDFKKQKDLNQFQTQNPFFFAQGFQIL